MTEWFRSWHGAPTDSKWRAIAVRASVPHIYVPAIAWALFDFASQAEPRGSVEGFDFESYALDFGIPEEQVRAVYAAMEAKGMIVLGQLAKWEKRQPRREGDTSTSRVREHRSKRAEQEPGLPLDEEKPAPEPVKVRPPAETIIISPEAMDLGDKIAAAVGYDDPQAVPASWCGASYKTQEWLSQGWQAPLILESVRALMARKRDGPPRSVIYFEEAIRRVHAQLGPKGQTSVVPFHGGRNGKSSVTAAIDQYIADLETGGGEVGQSAVRAIPDGRSQ